MPQFIGTSLSYDDVLVLPAYSQVLPAEVSTTTNITKNITINIPIISAAMDTVTEVDMAISLGKAGGCGIVHKNMSGEQQAQMVAQIKKAGIISGAAIGVGEKGIQQADLLIHAGVDILVLDSAHGHSKGIIETLITIKKHHPGIQIIAGNIATGQAAKDLVAAGADAVKVGIGPGSICTTRVISGVGRAQFSAILDVAESIKGSGVPVIADGGIKQSGDIVKALVAGASCVMLGSVLSGTDESPGEILENEAGKKVKTYRGMGSIEAMKKGSADRYAQEASKKLVPEGIVGTVEYKGPVHDIIYQYVGGIRSGMGYCGAETIQNMRTQTYTQITGAGYRESHPHSVTISHDAPNYKAK